MAFLDIKNRIDGDAVIVEFHGEIDKSTIDIFKNTVTPLVEQNPSSRFIFDFTDLKFINSEGIGSLMAFHTRLVKREKKLILVGLQSNVRDVLDLIGLTKLIPNYPDMVSAK